MKILTLCEQGLNRSVVAKYMLQNVGHQVLAAGVLRQDRQTLAMLFAWADLVILMDKRYASRVVDCPKDKLRVWDVGPDRFHWEPDGDLMDLIGHWPIGELMGVA